MLGNGRFLAAPNIPTPTRAKGMWGPRDRHAFLRGQAAANGLVWPAAQDASFASVKLLVHFNAVSSSGQFLDLSGNANHLTPRNGTGSVTNNLSPDQTKWWQYSYFAGGDVKGLTKTVSGLDPGTGDFTIEIWFYTTSNTTNQALLDTSTGDASANNPYFNISNATSKKLAFYHNITTAVNITGTTDVSNNAWHFGSISRQSGSTFMHLDGGQEGSTYTDANNYAIPAIWVGQVTTASGGIRGFIGYFGGLRITIGVGRYAAGSYTVPTVPFPSY